MVNNKKDEVYYEYVKFEKSNLLDSKLSWVG